MDPKNLNQLDPKLKAAYDRVMSTSVSPTVATTPRAPQTATPAPTTPPPPPPATAPHAPHHATNLMESTTPSTAAIPKVADAKKAKGGVSPIILILGGIVFFAVYTLLWVTVFKIPIPFLPQQ